MTFTGTLTPDQITETIALRDEWMRIALSTDPCDRPAAENAVRAAYTAAGTEPPPLVVWMSSPLGGVFAKTVLRRHLFKRGQLGDQLWDQLGSQLRGQLRGQLGDQLGSQLWGQLRSQLGDQLGDQLGSQLWGQLRSQLWGQLWDQLRGQLGDQLWSQLWGQLWDQLRGQLGDQIRDEIPNNLSPWYEAYWISLYAKALTFAGLPASKRLDTLSSAVAETGWWWPLQGAVVLTDRPTALHRDQQGRLHHETGQAISYSDGWGGSYWHGNHVPDDLVAGDGWSPERILTERNVEIRRAAIEKRGWDRFVQDAGLAQVGGAVPDPGNPGRELRLYDVPAAIYDEPVRVLLCENGSPDRDGTRRRFGLTVPADMPDPVTAAGWTYGCSPAEYAGLARRT